MSEANHLNLVGWVSPMAILELKRALSTLGRGEVLQVALGDRKLLETIEKTIRHSPDVITGGRESDGAHIITIQKGPLEGANEPARVKPSDRGESL